MVPPQVIDWLHQLCYGGAYTAPTTMAIRITATMIRREYIQIRPENPTHPYWWVCLQNLNEKFEYLPGLQ
jgi:hypothetical protein